MLICGLYCRPQYNQLASGAGADGLDSVLLSVMLEHNHVNVFISQTTSFSLPRPRHRFWSRRRENKKTKKKKKIKTMRLRQDGRLHLASRSSGRRALPTVSSEISGYQRRVHAGSTVLLSVESCWQHASGDQRAPLPLPHEWLMFSIFSVF